MSVFRISQVGVSLFFYSSPPEVAALSSHRARSESAFSGSQSHSPKALQRGFR